MCGVDFRKEVWVGGEGEEFRELCRRMVEGRGRGRGRRPCILGLNWTLDGVWNRSQGREGGLSWRSVGCRSAIYGCTLRKIL